MTRQQHNSFWTRFKNYCARHGQAGLNSLGQLSRTPLTTFITCIVIGIALALPMGLFVLLKNVENISQNFQQSTQITVYLKPDTTKETALTFLRGLNHNPDISEARAISPEQGLQELQESDATSALGDFKDNPIPWSIVILPANHTPADLEQLGQRLKQLPEVETVQLDTLWVQRLFALIDLAHRVIYGLGIFLAIGVLLIINNCIRSAAQNNRKEIEVIKLIGGTNAFIRRPFLYAGMIYGLLGGILAWQLVDLLLIWIKGPASQLTALYHSQFQLLGIGLDDTFYLLIISLLLGLIGAWLAVARHLRTNTP